MHLFPWHLRALARTNSALVHGTAEQSRNRSEVAKWPEVRKWKLKMAYWYSLFELLSCYSNVLDCVHIHSLIYIYIYINIRYNIYLYIIYCHHLIIKYKGVINYCDLPLRCWSFLIYATTLLLNMFLWEASQIVAQQLQAKMPWSINPAISPRCKYRVLHFIETAGIWVRLALQRVKHFLRDWYVIQWDGCITLWVNLGWGERKQQ